MHMKSLKDLVDVRAGHPFRGSVLACEAGPTRVIQLRDVSADGRVAWASLVRTELLAHKPPDWLHDGELLFAGRGGRAYALCLHRVPEHTVCAQYFFVLRCRPTAGLLPEYLAWYINRAPSQRYLMSNAEGSTQLSIRRAVLEDLPVPLPDLARQRVLVKLARAAANERQRLDSLIRNREQQMDVLAQHLLTPPQRPHAAP